jgi:modulator of drug activity B
MANILIINGHQKTGSANGQLNKTLVAEMKKILKDELNHKVKITTVQKGYDVAEEQQKFMWADTIIFQFPVYWFGVPALMKQYMQDVYGYGVFYQASTDGYGHGGMLDGKTYMLSSTWNAPADAFGNGFWQDVQTPDTALVAMHKTQSFIGLKPLPSFSCHNVMKDPQMDEYLSQLRQHLITVFG